MLQKYIRIWHICCKCFRGMLQAFVQNISSVSNMCCKHFDLDVAYVSHIYVARASVLDVCCKRFDLDVTYVSHICYKSMFEMFQPF
jgi:hypothetical protein